MPEKLNLGQARIDAMEAFIGLARAGNFNPQALDHLASMLAGFTTKETTELQKRIRAARSEFPRAFENFQAISKRSFALVRAFNRNERMPAHLRAEMERALKAKEPIVSAEASAARKRREGRSKLGLPRQPPKRRRGP
jgi:hypothetical protein